MTKRRPPGGSLRSVSVVARAIGSRPSAGDRLTHSSRAVRARGRTSTAALDQHHSRRPLDSKNRAKHRGVVPVGPTPPARRHRRPRRQRRGSAWDVVIHLSSPWLLDVMPGLSARLTFRGSLRKAGVTHRAPCAYSAREPWRRWACLLQERTNRQPGVYFVRRGGLRRAPAWHGPLERREYSTSSRPAGQLTVSRV